LVNVSTILPFLYKFVKQARNLFHLNALFHDSEGIFEKLSEPFRIA